MNDGEFYRGLNGRTVRLVVAATRGLRRPESDMLAIPGVMARQDVVYLYFFARPAELPTADELIAEKPVWHATATVIAGLPTRPRSEPDQRQDTNWIALARPDLLV